MVLLLIRCGRVNIEPVTYRKSSWLALLCLFSSLASNTVSYFVFEHTTLNIKSPNMPTMQDCQNISLQWNSLSILSIAINIHIFLTMAYDRNVCVYSDSRSWNGDHSDTHTHTYLLRGFISFQWKWCIFSDLKTFTSQQSYFFFYFFWINFHCHSLQLKWYFR